MQGQRSAIGSLPESLGFDHGSTPSEAGIDQHMCWNNMRNSASNRLSDYISPNNTGVAYLNSTIPEGQNLSEWSMGEPSSSAVQNQLSHNEQKAEHSWASLMSAGDGPILDDQEYVPIGLSLNDVNVNLSSNQIASGPLFLQSSSSDSFSQDLNINAGFEGQGVDDCQIVECPLVFRSGSSENSLVQSGSSSSNPFGLRSGEYMEENDGRPGYSLDGRRLSCKRKAIEGNIGQSSGSGSSNYFQHAEGSVWHSVPARRNTGSSLTISGPSESSIGVSQPEQVNPRLGLGVGGVASDIPPALSAAGSAESSRRNFRLRINSSHQQDSISTNVFAAGSAVGLSNVPSTHQSSRLLPLYNALDLRSATVADSASPQGQSLLAHVPAMRRNLQSSRWNRSSSSRPGSSSSFPIAGERDTASHEESSARSIPRNILGHPMFVPASGMRNSAQSPVNWSLPGGNSIASSRSGSTSANSRTSSEVYVIDANNPQDGLQMIHKRVPGVQYFLEHHNGFFYALTNVPLSDDNGLSSGNYYLTRRRVQDIKSANWENIILPSEDTSIQDMDIFNEHLVLFLNRKGSPVICAITMPIDGSCMKEMEIDDLNPWYFPLPSNSCGIVPGSNHDFMSSRYRAILSSPVIPDLIVDYDMFRRTFSIVHQDEVLGISPNSGSRSMTCEGESYEFPNLQSDEDKDVIYNEMQGWRNFSDAYCCEIKEVVSRDGTRIPLTILYSRKAHQKAQSPGILQGYGAYGEVLDKSWYADRLSLLDRGWVVAFADVRGGGGVDPSWHRSGRGLYKSNSIFDFVSCGEYLINEGYVHKCRLGAVGCSAGCLLAGAASNMYPELFQAIILKVPFLDICNTLLDPNLPLTILDYEEFGNPQIRSQFQCILSYSPYDNVPSKVCCPAMLVTASFNDSRVGVWEAAKWVAKVRDNACPKCCQSVILKTNMSGGHFGEGGRFGQCEESAYEYAFLMKAMGLSDKD